MTYWHSAQLYKDFFSSLAGGGSSSSGIITGEPGVDKTDDLSGAITNLQGTGGTLFLSGFIEYSATLPHIDGFYISMAPGAVLSCTLKTGGQIWLTGDGCGIEGGTIENTYQRPYTITVASVTSNVLTVTAPGHPFVVGDLVTFHGLTGVGAINQEIKTVTGVNGDTISVAHTNGNASATIPTERNDLHNTDANPVYPEIVLSRSAANTDCNVLVLLATNWYLRNLTCRYSRQNTLYINSSSYGSIHNYEGYESQADGVYITNRCHHLKFTGYTRLSKSNDTAFSIVSPRSYIPPCSDIDIELLECQNVLSKGNGLDLLGADRISIKRFIADNIYSAGINIFADSSAYYTFGSKSVNIEHATLRSCGNVVDTTPSGWNSTSAPALKLQGIGDEQTAVVDITFGVLEIFNSRWRPINDSYTTTVYIRHLHLLGAYTGSAQLAFPKSWRVDRTLIEEMPEHGLALGGIDTLGESLFGDLEFRHVNNGAPIGLVSASCNGTTLTFVTETAHGLAGTPTFRTCGITSNTFIVADNPGSATAQDLDYACNGDWISGITYSGISFPDTFTIALTGTGLAATSSPSVYSARERIPKARLYKGSGTNKDAILVIATAPPGSFILNRMRLTEQTLPVQWLLNSGASIRAFDCADLTGKSSGIFTAVNYSGELGASPAFARFHSGAYTGTPTGALVTGSTIYIVPIFLAQGVVLTKLGFNVSTLEANADARIGLYSLSNYQLVAPAELTNAFNSTGDKEATISQYVPRGWYYIALNTNCTGTGQILFHTIDGAARARDFDSAAASNSNLASADFRLTQALAYGVLPATLTAARVSSTTEPHLWVRWGV